MKKLFFILFFSALCFVVNAQSRNLTGNAGTNSPTNYIGTSDCQPLVFKTDNKPRMFLSKEGTFLGVGTTNPQSILHLHRARLDYACDNVIIGIEAGEERSNTKLLQLTTHFAPNGLLMYYNNNNVTFKHNEPANFFLEGLGGGLTIAPDGNIGMGTDAPKQKLHIVDGNLLISKTSAKAPGCPNGSILFGADITTNTMGKWGIEYLNGEDNAYGLNFWKPWNPGEGGSGNYILFLGNDNNIGIGKKDPSAKLDVAGNVLVNSGIQTLSLGSAYHQNLSYGTSYIGFNAKRDNGNWTLAGDGANNGGAVIWGTVDGSLVFASIPKTGGSTQTLSDAQIKNNIKLCITPAGKLKAKEIQVSLAGFPDYVFEKDYPLLPLSDLEQYIEQNQHLPNIPSAAEVVENGLDLGDMQSKLLLKIEELTLYILQQEKKMTDLQKQINELKNR